MGIERRSCDRVPVDFEIAIQYRDRQAIPARAGNVSSEGMFVHCDLPLATGTMVYLVFALEGLSWHIPALVVHANARGVGVMFRVSQPELCEYVRHHPEIQLKAEPTPLPKPGSAGRISAHA